MTGISTSSSANNPPLQEPLPEEAHALNNANDAGGQNVSAHAENAAASEESKIGNGSTAGSLATTAVNLLNEHKTHLAIGVAATLGLMVFYSWREKNLAKTDPEEYARIQRIKASVRNKANSSRSHGAHAKQHNEAKSDAESSPENETKP